jgi:hypothetical protein
MALTPDYAYVLDDLPVVYSENLPSKTYKIDFTKNRVAGKIDSIEAVKQAIKLILTGQRYALENFSFDYGSEISNLLGKPRGLVESELERLISEALMADERIKNVTNFTLTWRTDSESCDAKFDVTTIFGDTTVYENFYV